VSAPGGEPFQISEEERTSALSALVRATSAGQLTLEEFGRRTDLVLTTASRADLETVTDTLEAAPAAPLKRRWIVPFGNRILRGRFTLPNQTRATMLMSEIHLDLRGATLLGPEPTIKAKALMGTLRILVPSGVPVEVDQSSLFGGRTITTYGPPPGTAGPHLRVRMVDVLGGVRVTDDPDAWSPALMARR
jgi:hypothetical protein